MSQNGAQTKKKRPRKRRRRAELDLSSSSSEEEEVSQTSIVPQVPAEAAEASSDESSAVFSSSEDEAKPVKGKAASTVDATSEVASAIADEEPSTARAPRERSVSPPYFGFSSTRPPGKPLLWGHVHGDSDAPPAEDHPEYAGFRQFYLEKLVERFGDELDSIKTEVDSQDRLGMLIKSLSSGSDIFLSSGGPKGQRDVVLQAMAARKEASSASAAASADEEMAE